MTARALLAAAALLLGGCGHVTMKPVRVPVPVECRVDMPSRPAMPTEALAPGVVLDSFVAASQAEIEIREGYEGELRAALTTCTAPLVDATPLPARVNDLSKAGMPK